MCDRDQPLGKFYKVALGTIAFLALGVAPLASSTARTSSSPPAQATKKPSTTMTRSVQ